MMIQWAWTLTFIIKMPIGLAITLLSNLETSLKSNEETNCIKINIIDIAIKCVCVWSSVTQWESNSFVMKSFAKIRPLTYGLYLWTFPWSARGITVTRVQTWPKLIAFHIAQIHLGKVINPAIHRQVMGK